MKSITKIVLGTFLMAGILVLPAFADTTTTTTTTTIFRSNAPIYTGPVVVTNLEPLTLEDFQNFGTKPSAAFQEYQDYKLAIKNTGPDANVVPYKMRVDRDLTLTDFQATGVEDGVARERYRIYLSLKPVPVGGHDVRYVYVYHTPVPE